MSTWLIRVVQIIIALWMLSSIPNLIHTITKAGIARPAIGYITGTLAALVMLANIDGGYRGRSPLVFLGAIFGICAVLAFTSDLLAQITLIVLVIVADIKAPHLGLILRYRFRRPK